MANTSIKSLFVIAISLLTLSSLSITSCKKDRPLVYSVPEVIQPYIDEFIAQAAARGVEIEILDLIVELKGTLLLDGDEKAGLCTYGNSSSSPLIELDTTSFNWTMNDYTREQLIFHELGHCVLSQKGHRNSRLNNGNYSSYMRADGTPIYGRLSTFKKEYYLDELFDNNTPQPDWASSSLTYNSVQNFQKQSLLTDEFTNNSGGWGISSTSDLVRKIENGVYSINNLSSEVKVQYFPVANLNSSDNFEIEMNFQIPNSFENYCLMLWGLKITGTQNAYYYGYSNDGFLDVGEFDTQSFYNEFRNEIIPYEMNKVTVRRVNDFYYVYINEKIFDILSYETLPSKNIAFYISPQTELKIDYIRISKLNL